ncbi:hypothetical protein, partial [Acidithiobacillus sp.]|uniref:hypothetical protein n=1 Tax=Acidithiobacillus sp. TaxID=1872118 RepID=UPI003D064FEA
CLYWVIWRLVGLFNQRNGAFDHDTPPEYQHVMILQPLALGMDVAQRLLIWNREVFVEHSTS